MARRLELLTAKGIGAIKTPGLHADGGGLYLSTTNGGRRWVFIYRWHGKRREMGLGPLSAISLKRARELASQARQMVAEGSDPIAQREAEREAAAAAAKAAAAKPKTFGECADAYIAQRERYWKNVVHRRQWRQSLRDYAANLRDRPVGEIVTADVVAALEPIWNTKGETARRVRGRIEAVLDYARVLGLRPVDSMNPAQWRGHMEKIFVGSERLSRGHHTAVPYADVPAFMELLSQRIATAARALEFTILTAARTGEVIGARWREIDGNVWRVPADRMKAGKDHAVPLAPQVLAILGSIGRRADDDYIFPGAKAGRPLSNMAMLILLRRMKKAQFTVHGFRSSFKDWAANETDFYDELSEEALAHTVGSSVRRAYRRDDGVERRRPLLQAWADFATGALAKDLAA